MGEPSVDVPRAIELDPEALGLPDSIDRVLGVQLHLTHTFRRITTREAILIHGPNGWGEFCPFPEYGLPATQHWYAAAIEAACIGWPEPIRQAIPINATVPAVAPEQATAIVQQAGATTVKVKVADPGQPIEADIARLRAVRQALGDDGLIRIDANGAWNVEEAISRIITYNEAARPEAADTNTPGLEYVEQPCRSLEELARVREAVSVKIAADESVRLAPDPFDLPLLDDSCDLMIVKVAPLGGVSRVLDIVGFHQKPCVVSSALETAIGMQAGLALARAVPNLAGACGLGTSQLFNQDVAQPINTPVEERTGLLSPNNVHLVVKLDELNQLCAQLRAVTQSPWASS